MQVLNSKFCMSGGKKKTQLSSSITEYLLQQERSVFHETSTSKIILKMGVVSAKQKSAEEVRP